MKKPIVPTDIPFTSYVLSDTIKKLLARYPTIRQQIIGKSKSGAEIPALIFGTGKRAVCYNAAHHGNEWITSPLLLRFLEQYADAVSNPASDEKIAGYDAKQLFANCTLHLIPMLNPDGVDVAIGSASDVASDAAVQISKHFPAVPYPGGWKANANGVDLNLQYPAGWETAQKIKFSQGWNQPAPRDYVGPAPLSEPESRALYDYTTRHDFRLTLSYHSQGEVIYWRYLDHLPAGSREIGELFAKLSGYELEETPFVSGHAGYKDWFIKTYNRPGYTIEVGNGESPLPLAQFDKIYKDNEGILTTALIV